MVKKQEIYNTYQNDWKVLKNKHKKGIFRLTTIVIGKIDYVFFI